MPSGHARARTILLVFLLPAHRLRRDASPRRPRLLLRPRLRLPSPELARCRQSAPAAAWHTLPSLAIAQPQLRNAGEPRFLFYPPLTWMLGARAHWASSCPWPLVARRSSHGLLLARSPGLPPATLARPSFFPMAPQHWPRCAAALYSGYPYMLFTAYERSAFAENSSRRFLDSSASTR